MTDKAEDRADLTIFKRRSSIAVQRYLQKALASCTCGEVRSSTSKYSKRGDNDIKALRSRRGDVEPIVVFNAIEG